MVGYGDGKYGRRKMTTTKKTKLPHCPGCGKELHTVQQKVDILYVWNPAYNEYEEEISVSKNHCVFCKTRLGDLSKKGCTHLQDY